MTMITYLCGLQNLFVINQCTNALSPEVILLNPILPGGSLGIYHEDSRKAHLPAVSKGSGITAVSTYQG